MIKEKRKGLGYTQQQMADILKISLRQYVRIDTEEDLPRKDLLNDLINLLSLTDKEIGKYIRSITHKSA